MYGCREEGKEKDKNGIDPQEKQVWSESSLLNFFLIKYPRIIISSYAEWPLPYLKKIDVTALQSGHQPVQKSLTLADSGLFLLDCAVISTEAQAWRWAEKPPVKCVT